MRRLLVLLVVVLLMVVGLVQSASAGDDADCSDFPVDPFFPFFPVHLVEDAVVDGNLTVPGGVGCVVINSTVNGDVLPDEGAFFVDIVVGSSVNGNVEVPEGTSSALFESDISGNYICDQCFFEDVFDSRVGGNVEISGEQDGSWIINSVIDGNLQIEDSGVEGVAFWVQDSTVHGNVEIKDNEGPVYLFGNRVEGNVSIVDNKMQRSFFFPGPIPLDEDGFPIFPWVERETFKKAEIIDNQIGGNLEYKDNRGGKANISDNLIEGNLTCDGNKKKPVGGNNTADNKEGQCRNL